MNGDLKSKRVLVLHDAVGRNPDNSAFYRYLGQRMDVAVVGLSSKEQKRLRHSLRKTDLSEFDVILSDLYFKRIANQTRFLNTIENLFILEEDALQNFMPSSKRYGQFDRLYSRLRRFKLLTTNIRCVDYFTKRGVDVKYFPKGYDGDLIYDRQLKRDIEFGFIGRLRSTVYGKRREFLEHLAKKIPLDVFRTEPGEAYAHALNRIRFFISADIGFDEYMIKNFEAMGAGCVLCAYRQGSGEEERLGLIDMENVVLYQSMDELLSKLAVLRDRSERVAEISANGCDLSKKKYSYKVLAEHLAVVLNEDILNNESYKGSWFSMLFSR